MAPCFLFSDPVEMKILCYCKIFLLFHLDTNIYKHCIINTSHHAYVYIHISEMNESSDTKSGREELGLFCYYEVQHPGNDMGLFENRLRLIVNVYCTL